MEFSSKEDIEAPIQDVFAALSEFEAFERSAIRRGVDVQRVDESAQIQVGMAWEIEFDMRGKRRKAVVTLTRYEPETEIAFEAAGSGLKGQFELDLMALSPQRTRMSVSLQMEAKSLPARLFLQSLKLARGNLSKRFKLKVADYAKALEDRFSRTA
ncbi:MAG: SRPBCC family protein [Rhodobacteraceae bacterium]|nr:SRPBCC family protein [Paracoccaceae bacterium]